MKKVIVATIASLLSLSAVAHTHSAVPCAAYLNATPYAHVVNKKTHQAFNVERHLSNGISTEKYMFSNGKVMHGESRVVAGHSYCDGYLKDGHHYVKDSKYTISKRQHGYSVKVFYDGRLVEELRVYPVMH